MAIWTVGDGDPCYGYYVRSTFSGSWTAYYDDGGSVTYTSPQAAGSVTNSSYEWADTSSGSIKIRIGKGTDCAWVTMIAKRVWVEYIDSEDTSKSYKSDATKFGITSHSVTVTVANHLNTNNRITTPTGKKFKEWNTKPDGSGTSYLPDDKITVQKTDAKTYVYISGSGQCLSKTITLYAIWEWDGLGNIGGKKALCYICDGHDENNNPIWKQVLPYAHIRNSENILGWRLGIGGSS